MSVEHKQTLYERMGGADTINRLVQSFYAKVAQDPDLSPIFPDDLTLTREKQRKFLTQFFGGPPLFSQEYGHPMLRARHMRFPVTPTRAKAWLSCMQRTLTELDIDEEVKQEMFRRLVLTAQHMINTPDKPETKG